MRVRYNAAALAAIGLIMTLVTLEARGAKAPVADDELVKRSAHIVSGTVIRITSTTGKSKVEKAWGIHRDRVFSITLHVQVVSKGSDIRVGDEIPVTAWQPTLRFPPVAGPQGHHPIPQQGDRATFYLESGAGGAYTPILPNGIAIANGGDAGQ